MTDFIAIEMKGGLVESDVQSSISGHHKGVTRWIALNTIDVLLKIYTKGTWSG